MVLIAALAFAPLPARAADDAWSDDVRWISVRIGSAGSGARFAPNGSFGYGFGYTWFLTKQVAWSATVQHDVLGRFGDASEVEVPIMVEFTKHFRFSAPARPYLGAGWGAVYHKTSRTGADESGFRQGLYVTTGGNAALNAGSLIGVDFRVLLEQDTRSINPTFPNSQASSTRWSVKLSYSRVL
jgi:outer membrane protein W